MHLTRKATLGKAGLALALLTVGGLASAPARAQTILNFNNFTAGTQAGGLAFVNSPYSTQGFTLTSTQGGFDACNGSSQFGDGETSLYSNNRGSTTLTQNNGQAFSLNAIDLGPRSGNSLGNLFDGPVLFTGTRVDRSTVTATETTTSAMFQTFTFSGFTGLQSLTFTPTKGDPLFDNIKLNQPSAAPEPSQIVCLGFTTLGVLGLILKARKRKAQTAG